MVTSRKSFMVTRCLSIQNEPAKTGSFASNTSLSLSLRHSQIVKVTRFVLPIGSIIWDLQAWKHEAILVDIPKYPVSQYFKMISSYIPHIILATSQVQKSKAMRMPAKPTAITNSSLTWWMILCKSSMSPNCTFSYFFSSCDVFPRRCRTSAFSSRPCQVDGVSNAKKKTCDFGAWRLTPWWSHVLTNMVRHWPSLVPSCFNLIHDRIIYVYVMIIYTW